MKRQSWYHIMNAATSDTTEMVIDDVIGPWFGVTAKKFMGDLRAINTPNIVLHMHTPGGEVFDGLAIYNALVEHPAQIEVRIDGVAASIGSVIAMAGDKIVMAKRSSIMIHEPFGMVAGQGDADDMRELSRDAGAMAGRLDAMGDMIAGIYADRAGGEIAEWRARMRAETWFWPDDALEVGLVDEIGPVSKRAHNHFDLSIFQNTPPELLTTRGEFVDTREPTIRDAETALREAGLSRAAAKAILARGWDGARDAPPTPVAEGPRLWPDRIRVEADLLELAIA